MLATPELGNSSNSTSLKLLLQPVCMVPSHIELKAMDESVLSFDLSHMK